MKRYALLTLLILIPGMTSELALAQRGCQFNIVGDWQPATAGSRNPNYFLRLTADGIATAFSRSSTDQGSEWREGIKSRYKLDNPAAPKLFYFLPIDPGGNAGEVEYQVTHYDDGTFTTVVTAAGDMESTRWVRVDPQRYFIVLVAGKGTPDIGAAAFAMLIKSDGHQTQTEAFGLYPVKKEDVTPVVGTIPDDVRKEFAREPADDSAVMLRLEVTVGPYARALRVLKTWERRAHENTLPYPYPYLNNAVYLDELALSLNQCAQTIKMYELTWRRDDPINQRRDLPQVPYRNIKELQRLNDSLHVRDAKFYEQWQALNLPPKK